MNEASRPQFPKKQSNKLVQQVEAAAAAAAAAG
jgi:hypothetical protein